MKLHPSLCSFLILLATSISFANPAYAKRRVATSPPPVISSFYADPITQVTPGNELNFTVEGTPRGRASVRITGISRTIPLAEVDDGIYEGSYTIRNNDQLAVGATARATLKVRARSVTTTLAQTLMGAPVKASAPPVATPPAATSLAASRFTVTPISKIEPGADLKFALDGTPGAKASFNIEGVAKDIAMQETKSGHYEGSYTIRRLDHFPATMNIVGSLEANGQVSRTRLNQSLLVDAKPPVIKNITPRDNETVPATGLTSISGTFDDTGGVGVDPKSVKILVGGRDVTSASTVTSQFFNYRAELRPGTYPVEVTVKDMAGNSVRQAWNFTVAGQAPAASLPLQVLSHNNNAQVNGNNIEVRGRTAPDATVAVQVQAIASLAGLFGVNQSIYNQTLRADANGNFGFNIQPAISVPGMRYEITFNASKGDLNKEMKLVLFQQK